MDRFIQGDLFPTFQRELQSHRIDGEKRKKHILNLQLHNSFPTEGKEGMPLLSAVNGTLPAQLISYTDRNKNDYSSGIHCYLYDYKIEPIWNSPSSTLSCLKKYCWVIAPDFSLFVDQPRALNVWNVYRNRWVSSYWQSNGINVIPSASWGNIDSFEYSFDGLPQNSIIAIGHTVTGKDKYYKKLYRIGVETLIEKKHPTSLVVYGAPLDFQIETPVFYYEGIIQ